MLRKIYNLLWGWRGKNEPIEKLSQSILRGRSGLHKRLFAMDKSSKVQLDKINQDLAIVKSWLYRVEESNRRLHKNTQNLIVKFERDYCEQSRKAKAETV